MIFSSLSQALHNLKELGFEEARIIGALRATSNNQQQAVSDNSCVRAHVCVRARACVRARVCVYCFPTVRVMGTPTHAFDSCAQVCHI